MDERSVLSLFTGTRNRNLDWRSGSGAESGSATTKGERSQGAHTTCRAIPPRHQCRSFPRDMMRWSWCVFIFLIAVNSSLPALSATLHGVVAHVVDGDTLDVVVQRQTLRVRLAAVDAPERGQYDYQGAKNTLQATLGLPVVLTTVGPKSHGRLVALVFVLGMDVGLAQAANGHAWLDPRYAPHNLTPVQYQHYREAVASARKNQLGLWAIESPMPPWEFRQRAHR